jgi:dynein heavy chain
MERYNSLLAKVSKNLADLEKGVQGLQVITPDLQDVMEMMGQNRVPPVWGSYYFSLKSLSRWLEDLIMRMEFFSEWCSRGLPFVFNMSCFTYPQGFTTALLQRFSRKSFGANIVSIDKLEFDFLII